MTIVVNDKSLQIEQLQLGPFGTNAYILTCQETKESAVVDAPAEADKIISRLKGTAPRYILLTHSHMDHIGALAQHLHIGQNGHKVGVSPPARHYMGMDMVRHPGLQEGNENIVPTMIRVFLRRVIMLPSICIMMPGCL